MNTIEDLPNELLFRILDYCVHHSSDTAVVCIHVCKLWSCTVRSLFSEEDYEEIIMGDHGHFCQDSITNKRWEVLSWLLTKDFNFFDFGHFDQLLKCGEIKGLDVALPFIGPNFSILLSKILSTSLETAKHLLQKYPYLFESMGYECAHISFDHIFRGLVLGREGAERKAEIFLLFIDTSREDHLSKVRSMRSYARTGGVSSVVEMCDEILGKK